ncbi:VP3 [Gokushovirus WZ-2015a]|nr:VP3 [Gokushovirus WZ-2015a]
MMFRTQYISRDRIPANAGEQFKALYTPVFDKEGNFELQVSGKEDLYASIQSHAESVDIHVILERFARGDISALSKVQGTFGDFTSVPKTYAELLNSVIQGEQYFLSLPVETRAKFDHDFHKWMISMDNMPDWLSKMGIDIPSETSQSVPKEEAKVPPVEPVPST